MLNWRKQAISSVTVASSLSYWMCIWTLCFYNPTTMVISTASNRTNWPLFCYQKFSDLHMESSITTRHPVARWTICSPMVLNLIAVKPSVGRIKTVVNSNWTKQCISWNKHSWCNQNIHKNSHSISSSSFQKKASQWVSMNWTCANVSRLDSNKGMNKMMLTRRVKAYFKFLATLQIRQRSKAWLSCFDSALTRKVIVKKSGVVKFWPAFFQVGKRTQNLEWSITTRLTRVVITISSNLSYRLCTLSLRTANSRTNHTEVCRRRIWCTTFLKKGVNRAKTQLWSSQISTYSSISWSGIASF